jgi:hypothetical protein
LLSDDSIPMFIKILCDSTLFLMKITGLSNEICCVAVGVLVKIQSPLVPISRALIKNLQASAIIGKGVSGFIAMFLKRRP